MDNELIRVFRQLRQDAKESVNSGKNLSDFSRYIHAPRPAEDYLKARMREIATQNGGIVLLVGSAGDGKSHMLSSLKEDIDSMGFVAYNDATESSSPHLSAIQILKKALVDFRDANIADTAQKLILAINLGKLSAFIDDEEVLRDFSSMVRATRYLVKGTRFERPEGDAHPRIKIVDLSTQNLFELYTDRGDEPYPVDSSFMKTILDRVTERSADNPFFKAFKNSLDPHEVKINPVMENYRLLSIPAVKDSIVKLIIEAIIRLRLIVTPRDFLDFIYSIVVPDSIDRYKEKTDFYSALLPSLLFKPDGRKIQQALAILHPLKSGCQEHDLELAELHTADDIPEGYFAELPIDLESRLMSTIRTRYSDHGRNTQHSARLVFCLKHLLKYHSDSEPYRKYLQLLCCIFSEDPRWKRILSPVEQLMPRHYGSYVEKRHYVPLQNLQGSKYALFSRAEMHRGIPSFIYDAKNPSHFRLEVMLNWKIGQEQIRLVLDYKLFEYLENLKAGKLPVNYEGEQNMAFGTFIQDVVKNSECKHRIIALSADAGDREELLELALEEDGEINLSRL